MIMTLEAYFVILINTLSFKITKSRTNEFDRIEITKINELRGQLVFLQ